VPGKLKSAGTLYLPSLNVTKTTIFHNEIVLLLHNKFNSFIIFAKDLKKRCLPFKSLTSKWINIMKIFFSLYYIHSWHIKHSPYTQFVIIYLHI